MNIPVKTRQKTLILLVGFRLSILWREPAISYLYFVAPCTYTLLSMPLSVRYIQ